jgi:hypothetical protein
LSINAKVVSAIILIRGSILYIDNTLTSLKGIYPLNNFTKALIRNSIYEKRIIILSHRLLAVAHGW